MIHIPMENCRQLQLEMLKVNRKARQEKCRSLATLIRLLRVTLEGYGVATAESAEIHTVAMIAGYHGQTCNAALSSSV
jgi:hypothetical protein